MPLLTSSKTRFRPFAVALVACIASGTVQKGGFNSVPVADKEKSSFENSTIFIKLYVKVLHISQTFLFTDC